MQPANIDPGNYQNNLRPSPDAKKPIKPSPQGEKQNSLQGKIKRVFSSSQDSKNENSPLIEDRKGGSPYGSF